MFSKMIVRRRTRSLRLAVTGKVVRKVRRKDFRRVLALVMAVAVAVGLTVPVVYAASGFNSIEKGSITVNISKNVPETLRKDVTVKVYKVASAEVKNGYVSYTKDPLFDPKAADNTDGSWMGDIPLESTEDQWPTRAKSLAGYTEKEGFTTRSEAKESENFWIKKTDTDGSIKIEGLARGLYLITIESVKSGRTTYTFTPTLRCLPSLSEGGSEWVADQIVNPKSDKNTTGGGGGGDNSTTSVTVLKVWKDEGQESDRPDSVTVELLRDGKVYASQELSKSNNWRHTWTGLSKGNSWVVNEVGAPSDKYTVLTESEGNTFTVTNTHTTDIDDPDSPLDPGPGPGGDPGTGGDIPPTNIDDPDVPLDPGQTPGDNATNIKDPAAPANAAKLPQTGQLWWPVPILAAAGIAFFSIGWLRSRKDESEENK